MSTPATIERRVASGFAIRSEGGQNTLVGYASVFDSASVDLGGFTEYVRKGAFARNLADPNKDVHALYDHDSSRVLGRRSAQTLRLQEDAKGLRVEIDVPDTTDGRDLVTLLTRGDVDSMSFGFQTRKDSWEYDEDRNIIRELLDVELFEVSVVTFPAYPDTTIGVRDKVSAMRDVHRHSREAESRNRQIAIARLRYCD